jgi:hypothetical protein
METVQMDQLLGFIVAVVGCNAGNLSAERMEERTVEWHAGIWTVRTSRYGRWQRVMQVPTPSPPSQVLGDLALWVQECRSPCYGGMILTGEDWRTQRKTCPSATSSTTNPTLTDPDLRSERLGTNCLSHGMATEFTLSFLVSWDHPFGPEDGGSMFLRNAHTSN